MIKPDLHIQQGLFVAPGFKDKRTTPKKHGSYSRGSGKESARVRQSNDQVKFQVGVMASSEFPSGMASAKHSHGASLINNFKKPGVKTATNQSVSIKTLESTSTEQRRPLSTSQEKPTDRSQSSNFQKVVIPKLALGKAISKPVDRKGEKENQKLNHPPLSARVNPNPQQLTPRQDTPQTERKGPGQISKPETIKKQLENPSSLTPQRNKGARNHAGPSSKSKEREQVLVQRKIVNQGTIHGNTNSHHNNTFKTFKSQPKALATQIIVQQQKQVTQPIQQQQSSQNTQKSKGLNGLVTSMKRGQPLPFQTNPNLKTPPTQKKSSNPTPPKQYSKSPKHVLPIQTAQEEDSNQIIQVFSLNLYCLKCLIQPAFNNCIYYQTGLIHYHYEAIYRQPSPYLFQFKLINKSEEHASYQKDLYEEHFIQNYNSIQYCKQFKQRPVNEIASRAVILPDSNKKRTIVFDLDETLIHCKDEEDLNADVVLTIDVSPEEQTMAYIYVRPYLAQMLSYLQKHFELIVFTASHQCYAEKVLDYIDPKRILFPHRFYRQHCVQLEENLFTKDLRIFKNRKLENILIVDNAAYSYCLQLDNGIPILPFYDNKYDKELVFLTHFLMDINNQGNWVQKNTSTFKLDFYSKSNSSEQCLYQIIEQTL